MIDSQGLVVVLPSSMSTIARAEWDTDIERQFFKVSAYLRVLVNFDPLLTHPITASPWRGHR